MAGMSGDLKTWLRAGRYLPRFMRDFHDQKDVFKCIAPMLENYKDSAPDYHRAIKAMSWCDLQMVVIDVFLWWMAQHGYTLQKSYAKMPFKSIEDANAARQSAETESLRALINGGQP
jgi:hypothetical protein